MKKSNIRLTAARSPNLRVSMIASERILPGGQRNRSLTWFHLHDDQVHPNPVGYNNRLPKIPYMSKIRSCFANPGHGIICPLLSTEQMKDHGQCVRQLKEKE